MISRHLSKQKYRLGFTLVEMLCAILLTTVVASVMGSMIFSAFHLVERLESNPSAKIQDALIQLEKVAQEIQKSPVYPNTPLRGSASEISFPSIVYRDGSSALKDFKLGQTQTLDLSRGFECVSVRYFYDANTSTLARQVNQSEPEALVAGVRQLRFKYAHAEASLGFAWKETAPEAGDPAMLSAIWIELELDQPLFGATNPKVERTFLLRRVHAVAARWFEEEARVIR